jgi:dipeptidyl aminopeptidase/acylaminoacyl peptidase
MRQLTRGWAILAAGLFLAAPLHAQLPRVLPPDYAKWETPGIATLSDDGRWLAVPITRVDMDGELQVHDLRGGGGPRVYANGSSPRFSKDGRWLAISIGLGEKERQARERARQPIQSRLLLLDLRTGEESSIERIASFAFSGDGRFLAMRGYPPQGERRSRGVDVIVRELATGRDTHIGNVSEFAWPTDGALLAYIVDAETRAGNGVRVFDAATGTTRTLESDTAAWTGLAWRRDAHDLAVLRVVTDSTRDGPGHAILAWTGLAGRSPVRHAFEPAAVPAFPTGARIVDHRDLTWSDEGTTVFFGFQPWPEKPAEAAKADNGGDEERPGIAVWHARDVDIIPEQKVRADMNRRRNRLAAWHPADGRFVPLAAHEQEEVTPFRDGKRALAQDPRPHERDRMFGPIYRDLYVVDVATGARTPVRERVQYHYEPSPGGRYVAYLDDDHYHVYDIARGTHTNVTASAPVSFINVRNDHTVQQKPPYGFGGWTTDDRLLLYDEFDIWEVAPDGTRHRNLTNGTADRVRHRLVVLDPEDRRVDLGRPTYVALYGDRTKQFGYGRLRGGRMERLILEDRNVGRITKAKDADVFAFVRQRFDESPNYWAGSGRLADARRVTDTNPFQKDYAWGRAELLDYRNAHGVDLQAALYYPADYEPGRQYPMLVYFYEITSNTLHTYQAPSERAYYNPTVWTQEGYFVLRPDIVYRDRNPGLSAVEALVPAVERAIATGHIDASKVGLIGHSWGGYQTAFTPTQTDIFAAAVAGAPLTELYSMYLSVYWNTGGTDARIFEISQGRMEVPPWQDLEAYLANSPVHHIERLNTPMLVMFGDKDGAVDFNQGVVMYNAARRAGKDFVLLVYDGENHGLAKRANQIDYHNRILEWFGHYLKGEEPAAWIREGVPWLDREREVRPERLPARPASDANSGR